MSLTSVIDTANKVPGFYAEVALGVGPRSAGDAPRTVVMCGHRLATGTAVVHVLVAVPSPDDARTLFGAGSELHLMAVAAFKVNPGVTLYAVPLDPPGAGVAAFSTIALTVGPSTADGSYVVTCGGLSITVAIPSGSSITAAALLVSNAINDQTDWPVSAVPTIGSIAVTAKHKGTRGNRISLRSSGTIAGITHTPPAANYLTSGTTVDTITTALAELAPERFHYNAVAHDDSVTLNLFRDHANTYAMPLEGRRQQVVAGCIDTLANAITLATTCNAARVQIAWHYNADDTPSQIAASLAALRAMREGADPAANISGLERTELLGLRTQPVVADRPLGSELQSALNNGLTPLAASSGRVYVVRGVTTRSLDAASNPDYAVLDTSKVTVPDYVADDLSANWGAFAAVNPKVGPDPTDPEDMPPEGVATPKMAKDWIYGRLKEHEAAGMINNVDALIDSLIVELAASPAGRLNAVVPTDVIEWLCQLAASVRQVG